MQVFGALHPGLRLRTLYPLLDQGGAACSLVYDLERNLLFEVPEEFQLHLSLALDQGDLDGTLLGWLAGEDLLTYEDPPPGAVMRSAFGSTAETVPDDLDSFVVQDDRVDFRLGLESEEAALATLACLFPRLYGVSRITLHLGALGSRLDLGLLRSVVRDAHRRATMAGQTVLYELTLCTSAVSRETAVFLERHPVRVRMGVDCAPGPRAAAEHGLRRLVRRLPERLVVEAPLPADGGLLELWGWAGKLGVRHLHVGVTTLCCPRPSAAGHEALPCFRRELGHVVEEMLAGLEGGGRSLLYEPVIQVVRRLAAGASLASRLASPSYHGKVTNGDVLPVCGLASVPEHAEEAEPASGFRRAEVEAGIRLFRRLAELDPDYLLGLRTETDDPLDPWQAPVGWFDRAGSTTVS